MKPHRTADIYRARLFAMDRPSVNAIRGVIFPELRKVGTAHLQERLGGDPKICRFFERGHQIPNVPTECAAVMVSATLEEWQAQAKRWEDEDRTAKAEKLRPIAQAIKPRFNNRPRLT